ncbi:uncharacterized protein BP5553_02199 [Venustampulla echinocandica]|uniref:DUF7580 domain-containing protein n=1 Tax=Venustampulla echinocandica TaxID=2656787 RepID=A0A370U365_9HELO|nr:uncharacterized protein BP5553_02199 [Venustampulla echinocandica]RDL42220.1 hypothetical protein BP5553_02199 [Venustampulla echinocandica]
MSGVELAGIVLGAFPLMISALEHYRKTAEVLEGWWKVKTEYRKCMRNLKYHKLAFEENLEELLLPLIADEEKLQLLINDPGGPEWKDPRLEVALTERMPKTYSSYLDTIEMMMEVVQELNDALCMNKAQFQSQVDIEHRCETSTVPGKTKSSHLTILTTNIEWQAQRIKLAFNKNIRQELFENFGDHNARLRDILGSSDRLADLRRARALKTNTVDAGLWKFWKHGNSLFNALAEAWSCKCQALHHANLLLQHRVSPTANFRVVFWFKMQLAGGQYPWTWQAANIKELEERSTPIPIKINDPATIHPATNGQDSTSISPTPKLAEQVGTHCKDIPKQRRKSLVSKFMQIKSSTSALKTQSGVGTVELVVYTPPTRQTTQSKVSFAEDCKYEVTEEPASPSITNLCTKIASCPPDLPEYGSLKGDSSRYTVQPLCKADNEPQSHINLETLLSSSSPITITRRQRLQIALILASSHVQLHSTPWLKLKWTKKDIFFLYDAKEEANICIDQPYISRNLSKPLQQQTNQGHIPSTSSANTHDFQDSIRNLGIMLLELCFGTAIEEHKLRRNLLAPDEQAVQLINYAVAIQWCRDVLEESGPEYSDAVLWCLHHHAPDCDIIGDKQDKWRADMFARVVEPLRCCYDHLTAGKVY